MNDKEDLIGYSGANFMDTGYFYAPYIPIAQTPIVLDPNSSFSKRGILTRYGKKILAESEKHYSIKSPKEYRSIDSDWEVSCHEE